MAKRKNNKPNKKNTLLPVNEALLNIIAPIGGLAFGRTTITIGDNICKIYAVFDYPSSVEMGWLAKFSNIPRTISTQVFEPVNNNELIQSLSRSVAQNRGIAESTRDALTKQRAVKAATDAETLMKQIDQNNETIGYMVNLVMAVARTSEELENVCTQIEATASASGCKARALSNMQLQAFKTLAPYHTVDEDVKLITKRNVPMSTYMGGFPFSASGFSDPKGYYLAKDNMGGLIILNNWLRGGDRTNSNWVIMGIAGVGKSTAVKHIATSEFAIGTKVIYIDPEREYRHNTKKVGGNWINAGGSDGKINPLEIPKPALNIDDDYEEEIDEDSGLGAMALHFKTLEIFFQLYLPDLSEIKLAILKEILENLYSDFGITWETDIEKFNSTDFPIFTDLYALLEENYKKAGGTRKESLEYLVAVVRELAIGADSFLWNGHTTINPRSDCICLDTHDLNNASDRVKKTQYFLLLNWCWAEMSKDRNERVFLVCDEAYLMIDPHVPQSLIFLRNVAKRARKYNSAIAVVSHSVVDFLDPSVKMYGQALLDIPCYKVLMGTDGKNLQETAELYNLTDTEQDFLASKKRQEALFIVGSKRILINFDIPEHRFSYFGKAGGI